jgi:hypothetical protein
MFDVIYSCTRAMRSLCVHASLVPMYWLYSSNVRVNKYTIFIFNFNTE